jgi:copper chaperone
MSARMEDAILTAPDISCAHCVATIKRAVGELDGVATVDVDPTTKQIAVRFDPDRVSRDRIEAVLDDEGYPVAN